ncbi:P-loop containing nucleoside triphosphate hydrolase protein [Thelonectria olida]|uniref:P-loop containing nucleoside triphosphate hydrolase protein n=1 Tax=Thelonectria olida TaxID=1576542 RepID=A0A9P8WFJ2_9HYPO|nr:P-loop containing nucleoside triphosphate hydrolase protein [Thelonectria olida]
MDVDNWQANRIRNCRYLQDGKVKPWPWGIQVQILGAEGCGRHSLLNRACQGKYVENYKVTWDCNSGCKQTRIRGQSCKIWFDTPVSLTSHGEGFPLSKQEHFAWLTRGIRDCDALILAYDLSNPKSFQDLIEFCARCELGGVGIAPGTSLPCLVVGLKSDLPGQIHVEDGWRLARRLGGRFMTCSAKTGQGFPEIVEAAVTPVIDARTRLIRESEETLGSAIRQLLLSCTSSSSSSDWRRRSSLTLRTKLSMRPRRTPTEARRPLSRARRCSGAPPRWTMRELVSPPPLWLDCRRSAAASDSGDSEATLVAVEPCPPEFQLPVDLLEPASTDWGPQFELIMTEFDDVVTEKVTDTKAMRWTI